MRVVNLLEFLNTTRSLTALSYAFCDRELINYLDFINTDEQFTKKIDMGIVYLCEENENQYTVVDGLNRLVSLSLLLHAVCECYKKTTNQNEKAIKTIRSKYLMRGSNKSKLQLNFGEHELYNKIINGDRLSGHEKSKPMFVLMHKLWTQIKEEKLQAAKIFTMLQKISIVVVNTDHVPSRDLYYNINSHLRNINQVALIEDYLKEKNLEDDWREIKESYFLRDVDIPLFLHDFLITKYNYNKYNPQKLYESFVNYFETMSEYMGYDVLIKRFKNSAALYYNMININFASDDIRNAFINIKKHEGEDTYAYILNVYEDYVQNNISESIFIEILHTIDEYLKNRQQSGKNIDFNELIQYLNAFITCK